VAQFPDTGLWRDGVKWRSPIHQPRAYSRLTLIVSATTIEPLQEITEEDASAEGVTRATEENVRKWGYDQTARMAFADLWDSLHGATAWSANPEVVALSLAVHQTNIDALPKKAA
jgi:hypothetical protein